MTLSADHLPTAPTTTVSVVLLDLDTEPSATPPRRITRQRVASFVTSYAAAGLVAGAATGLLGGALTTTSSTSNTIEPASVGSAVASTTPTPPHVVTFAHGGDAVVDYAAIIHNGLVDPVAANRPYTPTSAVVAILTIRATGPGTAHCQIDVDQTVVDAEAAADGTSATCVAIIR